MAELRDPDQPGGSTALCKGIDTLLIRGALAAARERGLKVIPICPFFAAYMRKHPEEHDLLDPAWRTRFGVD